MQEQQQAVYREANICSRLLQAQKYFEERQQFFDGITNASKMLADTHRIREGNTGIKFWRWFGFIVYCWQCFLPMATSYFEGNAVSEPIRKFCSKLVGPGFAELLVGPIGAVLFLTIYFGSFGIIAMLWRKFKIWLTAQGLVDLEHQLNTAVEALGNEYQNYRDNTGDDCPVPFDRCHPILIRQLLEMIQRGRADTVKEAINMVLQDEHNQRMEQMSAQQLAQQQQANAYLTEIQANTMWTAWNTFWR